jgi:glutathione S-transferase
MSRTLFQIPISHNCTKVRDALKRKGLAFDSVDVHPMNRAPVRKVSGQGLVPVLVDDGEVIPDSTRILLHLEERYPEPPLIPTDPGLRAECLTLEDWADATLMALSRRLAYWQLVSTPGALVELWMPGRTGFRVWLTGLLAPRAIRHRFGLSEAQNRLDEEEARRAAEIAMRRLGGRPFLVGDRISIADIALATMAAPLWAASPAVTGDPSVEALLRWGETILFEEDLALYRKRG